MTLRKNLTKEVEQLTRKKTTLETVLTSKEPTAVPPSDTISDRDTTSSDTVSSHSSPCSKRRRERERRERERRERKKGERERRERRRAHKLSTNTSSSEEGSTSLGDLLLPVEARGYPTDVQTTSDDVLEDLEARLHQVRCSIHSTVVPVITNK